MGMLFNTDATIKLLSILNIRYNLTNLTQARRTADLAEYNSTKTLYQIWQDFNGGVAVLNIGNSPNGETNFKTLLTNYETDNGDGTLTSDVIRSHIVNYLKDNINCVAIEFFAIPSHQVIAHPRFHVPHPSGNKKYSGIVAVETVTYDKTPAFVRFNRTKGTRKGPSKTRRAAASRSRK